MKRLTLLAIALSLVALGLSGWALQRTYDDTSTPKPTASVTTTSSSTTTTSTLTALVVIPSVVGKNGYYAGLGLGGAGLKTEVVRAPSVNVPPNYVISQSPLPGIEVPRGTVIKLTLSSGPASS